MSLRAGVRDRNLLLILCGVMLVVILGASLLAPQTAENDPRPIITNSGPHGVKAAYLTLQALGRTTFPWSQPLAALNHHLSDAQAARTTLILAAPEYDATEERALAAEVKQLLKRGGRVLATGPSGAALLPGGAVEAPGMLQSSLCHTMPEGPGLLADAGSVEMTESSQWVSDGPQYRVEQRCGKDAVVVRYAVRGPAGEEGEAVWWSSAGPMENAELKHNADLRLLLATLGDGRSVIFDESLHGTPKTLWDAAKSLPLRWLAVQAALLFVLLMVSFGRRRGPVRSPLLLPRSSPVEFAVSMGDLYEKGAATSAATEAARRRLLRVLTREAGIAQATVEQGPAAIAEALQMRMGGDWSRMSDHLSEAMQAQHGAVAMRSALKLVRALNEDAKQVRVRLQPRSGGRTEDRTELQVEV